MSPPTFSHTNLDDAILIQGWRPCCKRGLIPFYNMLLSITISASISHYFIWFWKLLIVYSEDIFIIFILILITLLPTPAFGVKVVTFLVISLKWRPQNFIRRMCWRAIRIVSRLRSFAFQLAMDTSLDGKYPLRGRTHCGDTDGIWALRDDVACRPSDGTERYRQICRNDLVTKWLESIRSNQIT